MFRKFLLIFVFIFYLFASVQENVLSSSEFFFDMKVLYDFKNDGTVEVTHIVDIENRLTNVYAASYSLDLSHTVVKNITADYDNKRLPVNPVTNENKTLIRVDFPQELVGKGKSRNFVIKYTADNLATKTGEVWEISIPKTTNIADYRNYSVDIKIPHEFGEEAYLSPDPIRKEGGNEKDTYYYNINNLRDSGVIAGFGKFQVFSFTLNYHLENPLNSRAETEITLPPDTAFQKVHYDQLEPRPENVTMDTDGNWIARYVLKPRERVDVTASGSVQIFSSKRPFLKYHQEDLSQMLLEKQYWEVNDPEIKRLATQLKTPKAIYDYVIKTLEYDYSRVRPNVDRYGAKKSLENKNQAICMEFTDLFIALSRSAGIPAREINGFAYTENPEIQPLSLVADVLHAWPEYWDSNQNSWIPVDPTWGKTTNGMDYFNKMDLRHFTFVIHGSDPVRPYAAGSYKLGANPQKDIFINFGKLSENKDGKVIIEQQKLNSNLFSGEKFAITLKNPGPTALYNIDYYVELDNERTDYQRIELMPPFSYKTIDLNVPFSLLAAKTPKQIQVFASDQSISLASNQQEVIINSLFIIFGFFLLLLITVMSIHKRTQLKILFTKLFKKNEISQPPDQQVIT